MALDVKYIENDTVITVSNGAIIMVTYRIFKIELMIRALIMLYFMK